jgi:ribosomal-protein-alanine N-acetyltransferase
MTIKKMDKTHKTLVIKIAYESMATLKEKFYFRIMLMFNSIFNFNVALCDDTVVGFISIVDSLRDALVIGNIAVTSRYKQKGVASLLLSNVLSIYPNRQVTLQVRQSNIAAQNLYTKFGFKKTNIVKNYYPNKGTLKKESGVVMVRK